VKKAAKSKITNQDQSSEEDEESRLNVTFFETISISYFDDNIGEVLETISQLHGKVVKPKLKVPLQHLKLIFESGPASQSRLFYLKTDRTLKQYQYHDCTILR